MPRCVSGVHLPGCFVRFGQRRQRLSAQVGSGLQSSWSLTALASAGFFQIRWGAASPGRPLKTN